MPSIYFLDTSDGGPPGATVACLDAAERERMSRYRFDDKQREFLIGRYFIKTVLREFHGSHAPVSAVEHQKPAVIGGGPHFSLSHSGGAFALIVSADTEVGIDVEPVRAFTDDLAEGALNATERPLVRSDEDFFRVWTAKEAYMKRAGEGLGIEPRRLTVDLSRNLLSDGDQVHPFHFARYGRFIVSWM